MNAFLTHYWFGKLTDFELGGASLTPPATWYVGLSLAVADKLGTLLMPDGSTGAEVTGAGYARVGVVANATNVPLAGSSWSTNGTPINFGRPTGAWGLVLSAFIADASSGGNILRTWDLPKEYNGYANGPAYSIPAGNLCLVRS